MPQGPDYRTSRDAFIYTEVGTVPVIAPQMHPMAQPSPAPLPQEVAPPNFTLLERAVFMFTCVCVCLAAIGWLVVLAWGYRTLSEMGARVNELGVY